MLLGLAVGTAAAGVIAWRLGELLGPAPTKAELTDVGGRVATALALHSLPALAVGPFCAVLAYLAFALFTRRDDLGRTHLPRPRSPRSRRSLQRSTPPPAGPRADRRTQFTVIGVANSCSGTGTAPRVCRMVSSRRSSRNCAASRRRVAEIASSACRSSVVSSAAAATSQDSAWIVGHRPQQLGGLRPDAQRRPAGGVGEVGIEVLVVPGCPAARPTQ